MRFLQLLFYPLLLASLLTSASNANQQPLLANLNVGGAVPSLNGIGDPSSLSHSGAALPTPRHLSSIGGEGGGFTLLTHPQFPGHRVRVRRSEFCDPTVSVYTGYLDVDDGAKHLFFYFFESRRDPENDDVMMWINGGPGCSSSMGLLMELGPCSIDMHNISTNGTIWNPYSWNEAANIFFLDQPVGVGFSYADHGETIETTEAAAKNVDAFIRIFFDTFTQFAGRALHLAGESYAGRYLPVFASEIWDKNEVVRAQGGNVVDLRSVIIGNGITDISTLYAGRYEVECGRASLDVPFQSIATCVRMKIALPRCEKALRNGCIDRFDAIDCRAAVGFCDSELSTGMWASGRNVYDITKPCIGPLCYEENQKITTYLNLPSTRLLLGLPALSSSSSSGSASSHPNANITFTPCSNPVSLLFNAQMDKWAHHTQDRVAQLLDRGVRVLVYAGTVDWQCNWVANWGWVKKLVWGRRGEFGVSGWRGWGVDESGVAAGELKEGGGMAFVTVRGAGHMMSVSFPLSVFVLG